MEDHCNKDVLEQVHIMLSSLIQASTHLHDKVEEFVTWKLVLEDRPDDNDDDVRQLWCSLDIHPDLLDIFVALNPQLRHGSFFVKRGPLATRENIINLVHYSMKFENFSDTDWGKVGHVTRLFCIGNMVGLPIIYNIANDPPISMYGINGYGFVQSRSGPIRYAVIAALSCRPVEWFTMELLQDDRTLLRHDELIQGMNLELGYLHSLSWYVWNRYGQICGMPAEDLKDWLVPMYHQSHVLPHSDRI